MRYALFNPDGTPAGFYSEDVLGPLEAGGARNPTYPDGVVAITDEHWQEFLGNAGTRRWTGTSVETFVPPAPTPAAPAVDPVDKLTAFLAANPDVKALIGA